MSLSPFIFQYRSLESPSEIRVVSLRRGSGTDLIECVLLHTEIHDQPYQALSYEWGLPSDDDPIILMDSFPVRIRTNLHEALKMIRLPDGDVWMWIDALCINQEDPQERGHQVSMMDGIYSSAEIVIVWLGEARDGSDFAMETFAKPSKLPQLIKKRSFQESQRQALVSLAYRSYWSRVWVLQEIYLARSFVVRCGCKCISDADLNTALVTFHQDDGQDYCIQIAKSTLEQHRLAKLFQEKNVFEFNSLGRWLRVCMVRNLQSSQPHDLIYALLGIAHDCPKGTIVPDYDKPLLDVYREVAHFWSRSADCIKLQSQKSRTDFLHNLAIKLGLDYDNDMKRFISDLVAMY